jgi:nucleoside-diphosphate-sugar epimerase
MKIVILGASGNVGFHLGLWLKENTSHDIYPVIRNTLGYSAYDTAGNESGQPYAVSAITQESDSVCTDNDGDGWCVQDGGCDDYNDKVYPGHKDTKGRWG